ncbi:hypothetical protein SODALDRAFT_321744 [Sodiomyces alkalinus F11]|uniref:Xylanolytic transcriptional activator regulatory domain-containing protein n=1 Tax=Sodiomyces alkalinus (strain CBS 110278 / VKM F-3762 / F11) TaxID=1314773 RepID=A0A3N2Q0U2_SODAK|nr:hypothetical protein SODALDRAFT_321744 [Sodiomyces alkalinus F11]ROT40377.1 hypothetical protein SODALDRAFT_321744 [Sodiomyces alkalinus F11]
MPHVNPVLTKIAGSSRLGPASTFDKPRVGFDTVAKIEPSTRLTPREKELDSFSGGSSSATAPDDETSLLQSTRMLQDPTGRLLYVGDSASLAYLQLIRIIVETRTGPNDFTLDPSRHKIMEVTTSVPPHIKLPHMLPDREAADILVESFFKNTRGLIEVFNRSAFEDSMHACYSDPLNARSSFLCLLYLTFALGMVLGTAPIGSREAAIYERLRTDQYDRAEIFFRNAKLLGDPMSGFEDADFWSIQALTLMAVYMLAVSKRNAAYAYFGMAVRSAYSFGLHRVQENDFIFTSEDVRLRRNLWRSLFVLDRFLAASLGRPVAIDEDECSEDALLVYGKDAQGELVPLANPEGGLDLAVRSCQIMGQILKKIYARRKISIRLAQEIAERCKAWSASLNPQLHGTSVRTTSTDTSAAISALHVNLLHCHSILLMTRPFFICLLSKVHNERSGHTLTVPRWINRMARYCEACLVASCQTIRLVAQAYECKYLPRRNPFVLYFLFAACLIALSNEFVSVYENPLYNDCMGSAIEVVRYCAETDPQANRLLYILHSFQAAVADVRAKHMDPPALPVVMGTQRELRDPVLNLFSSRSVSRKDSLVTVPSHPPPSGVPQLGQLLKNMENQNGSVMPGGGQASLMGVSPVSSGSFRDADGTEGELDFERLWNPGTAGASMPVGSGLTEPSPTGAGCGRDTLPPGLSGHTVSGPPRIATNFASTPPVATLYSPSQLGI